ncbi:hypothetical protein LTR78_010382 [Recurvomyces mirabilis]|uniref:Uncharacterized protein n=1 Tax=Recurvomyces mirabilis TaxID=574656 RepID=A0AAE0TN52_9PEZI|nr:hypothetical protein LTR78_010382 [Recurvomyces mirabilis]KAK5150116.1 hypothetical protein LTS14_010379 [Recurvomyces mirabilis]
MAVPGRPALITTQESRPSDARLVLSVFTTSINPLNAVRNLKYNPAFEDEKHWGQRWRKIEFHPEGLVNWGSFGVDPTIDALQLYIVLRAVLRAPNRLQAVELFTRGHAFWSPAHLRSLLDWTTTPSPHSYPYNSHMNEWLEGWIDDIGGPLRVIQYSEALTRDLVRIERGLARLSRVELRVDTIWSEEPGEIETIAQAISHMLGEATNLHHLVLVFRDHAISDECGEYTFFDHILAQRAPCQETVQQSMRVSSSLLSRVFHLKSLRHLHLSFAVVADHLRALIRDLTQLRHLELRYVALWSREDCWEDILQHIAHSCNLEHLGLRALEDIHAGQPRLILCPEASIWQTDAVNVATYAEYEDAIICFAMRKSESLPVLQPDEFLQRKRAHFRS